MNRVLISFMVGGVISLNAGFMDSMASQVGSMMQGATSAKSTAPATTNNLEVVSQLTKLLNVEPKQAIGGTAALMALASSKMPKDSYSSLLSSIPGLSSIAGGSNSSPLGSIVGAVAGAAGVEKSFKALGMDGSTVSKFAPALLEIFKNYTSSDNLNLLSKAWSAFLPKK